MTLRLLAVIVCLAAFTTSCQFKKKDFVEETQDKVDEISDQLAKKQAEDDSLQITDKDLQIGFLDGDLAKEYDGTVSLPSKVHNMLVKIESTKKINKLEDGSIEFLDWKTVPDFNAKTVDTNAIIFKASSDTYYKITASSVVNGKIGNSVTKIEQAPHDEIIDGDRFDSEENSSFNIEANRIFLGPNAYIVGKRADFSMIAKKIISDKSAVITNYDSAVENNPNRKFDMRNIRIQADQLIGTFHIKLVGVSGAPGISGHAEMMRLKMFDDSVEFIDGKPRYKKSANGTDAKSIKDICRKARGVDMGMDCNPMHCTENAGDGKPGRDGVPGLPATAGAPAGPTGDLIIQVKSLQENAVVFYSFVRGEGGKGQPNGLNIGPGEGGDAGRIDDLKLCSSGNKGIDGKPADFKFPAEKSGNGTDGVLGKLIFDGVPELSKGQFIQREFKNGEISESAAIRMSKLENRN